MQSRAAILSIFILCALGAFAAREGDAATIALKDGRQFTIPAERIEVP